MVDYHKKYLKYKQKHLMSKMNTFTGGVNQGTIDLSKNITGVLNNATDNTVKIIDQDGYLTTLTQMKFEEKNICNNKATLIKQVPCLSVVAMKPDDKNEVQFELKSNDVVVELKDKDVKSIMIQKVEHKANITSGLIKDIEEVDKGVPLTDVAKPDKAPFVKEYIITLESENLDIDDANMHTGEKLKKCTITFNIDTNNPDNPYIVKDTVILEMDKPQGP